MKAIETITLSISRLNQVLTDSNQTKDDVLQSLKQAPEQFIDFVFEKSLDEMTKDEREYAIFQVEDHIKDWFEHLEYVEN